MGRESGLWSLVRDHLLELVPGGHLQRVESWVGAGTPDVNGCLAGVEFWLELKVVSNRCRVPLRPAQVLWLTRRARAGGLCWVLARRDDVLRLWWGGHAQRLAAEGWELPPQLQLERPWDWPALLRKLTLQGPEPQRPRNKLKRDCPGFEKPLPGQRAFPWEGLTDVPG